MTCVNCDDHTIADCLECSVQMGNHSLLIQIYNDMQIVLKSMRIKDYIAAEEIATDLSERLAILAAEERKG